MPLPNQWGFEAIGTHWKINSLAQIDPNTKKTISSFIDRFDKAYSRFRTDSLINELARRGGPVTFTKEMQFASIFQLYRELYELTNGAMTPLIGDALINAGYDMSYTLVPKGQSALRPQSIDDMVVWSGADKISLRLPTTLDFGAAGKGLLVDCIARVLAENGYDDYVIDASGDILHESRTQYVIGLEDPMDELRVLGTVSIQGEALCASAINRRSWGSSHHIIDGRTLVPTRSFVATWVIANNTMLADAIATALFFLDEPEKKLSKYGVAYLRIDRHNAIEMNQAMKKRVKLFI